VISVKVRGGNKNEKNRKARHNIKHFPVYNFLVNTIFTPCSGAMRWPRWKVEGWSSGGLGDWRTGGLLLIERFSGLVVPLYPAPFATASFRRFARFCYLTNCKALGHIVWHLIFLLYFPANTATAAATTYFSRQLAPSFGGAGRQKSSSHAMQIMVEKNERKWRPAKENENENGNSSAQKGGR